MCPHHPDFCMAGSDIDRAMSSPPAGGDEVSIDVVMAVAVAEDVAPTELSPLATAIDPDALDALVASMDEGTVTFSYSGYRVTVAADGQVDIADERTARLQPERP